MPRAQIARPTSSPLSLLLLVALAAMLLQGSCLPHTHTGVGAGFYNQDHDLSLLATLHGAAVLLDAQPAPHVVVAVSTISPAGAESPAAPPCSLAESRAPPLT